MSFRLTTIVNGLGAAIDFATQTTLAALKTTTDALRDRFAAAATLASSFAARPTSTQVGAFCYGFDADSSGTWLNLACNGNGALKVNPSYNSTITAKSTAGAAGLEDYRGIAFGVNVQRVIAYHTQSVSARGTLFLLLLNKGSAPVNGDAADFCIPFPSDTDERPRFINFDWGLPPIPFTNGVQAVASTTADVVTFPTDANHNATRFYIGAL